MLAQTTDIDGRKQEMLIPSDVMPYDAWQISLAPKAFDIWTGLSYLPAIQFKTCIDCLPSGAFMLARKV